ncbi:MAG: hypothetical protein QXP01_00060 [Candidatus Hadarchaeum sp.]
MERWVNKFWNAVIARMHQDYVNGELSQDEALACINSGLVYKYLCICLSLEDGYCFSLEEAEKIMKCCYELTQHKAEEKSQVNDRVDYVLELKLAYKRLLSGKPIAYRASGFSYLFSKIFLHYGLARKEHKHYILADDEGHKEPRQGCLVCAVLCGTLNGDRRSAVKGIKRMLAKTGLVGHMDFMAQKNALKQLIVE